MTAYSLSFHSTRMSTTARLHITPLTPDLLPLVLGPLVAKSASNISYQDIETFPENSYGFVDLPQPDAKKLVAKLNGAILKGRKMKIEEARSPKRKLKEVNDEQVADVQPAQRRSKRPKGDKDVIEGLELSPERKVKRGWTEPKADKSSRKQSKQAAKDKKPSKHQAPSTYTEQEELLFRTKLPPNREELDTMKKHKKSKRPDAAGTVVHEFEKTSKQPSFLRETTSLRQNAEYQEGVGWVDQDGNVVEAEPPAVKRQKRNRAGGLRIDLSAAQQHGKQKVASGVASSPVAPSASTVSTSSTARKTEEVAEDETSSSGISSSDTEMGSADEPIVAKQVTVESDNVPALGGLEIHPLEALFKKPNPPTGADAAKPSLEVETSFSFFDRHTPENEDDLPPMPITPFTSQELNSRVMRSAAPTPDTAHPSRFSSFTSALASREGSASTNEESHNTQRDQSVQSSQSDFERRFWAERGQNNRAWKARSRAAKKEQRQKENRLRRTKA